VRSSADVNEAGLITRGRAGEPLRSRISLSGHSFIPAST
jgi:hypothetical protein